MEMQANIPQKNLRKLFFDFPIISGVTPFTTIDYPGHLSAVLFLQGCQWRCSYCHNQHLLGSAITENLKPQVLEDFFKRRQSKLDAIVISGGEPLRQTNLIYLIQMIKDHGFKVGLHTSGSFPERLEQVAHEVDWIGLDFKALFKDYELITKVPGSGQKAFDSVNILAKSSVDFELRTTVTPYYHTEEKLILGAQQISRMGIKKYSLQRQRDATNRTNVEISKNLIDQISPLFEVLTIR
jgi:pyruvate formate lyase activating enzyme